MLSLTKKARVGILIRDMKKYLSVLFALFIIASCSQTSYKSPHEKRDLKVVNISSHDVTITIRALYNSVVYQPNAVISHAPGTALELKGVPFCTAVPKNGYDWKIDGLEDNIDPTTWTIRNLTEDEKIKVTVKNGLSKDVKLKYRVKNDGKYPGELNLNNIPRIITLYDTDYIFELENQKKYKIKVKKNGVWEYAADASGQYITAFAIQTNPSDVPPDWAADPSNPADADKIPLFFTIDYDKAAKTISIKPLPIE